MSRTQTLIASIVFSRSYTLRLVESIPVGEWFKIPPAGVSHVAWQVGHLAMAQYRLALQRIRGERPDDAALISPEFLKTFGRDSVADPDPSRFPSPEEIRAVFERVYARLMSELPSLEDATLDQPAATPHAFCKTKFDCLHWCSHHEMLHAGQIGLLRRQLGHKQLW
ncbi:DinB family protein [Fimbriiglobus ruber]|uniref:DinB-like domain-containing protein n=1 Tax=Fimbriiglobus ruber TaxID=1908690 RepID=A0A225EBU3_9BACT|nr:DinB family protein [Fimbriiglobus ruber]OWK46809.1 hypothetical protein FRUB_00508 [Fimbriiglobus ruber]